MSSKIFCNVENDAFEAKHFVSGPGGVIVHVINETAGHTLDGWTASFTGAKESGVWNIRVEDIEVAEPPMVDFAERDLPQ